MGEKGHPEKGVFGKYLWFFVVLALISLASWTTFDRDVDPLRSEVDFQRQVLAAMSEDNRIRNLDACAREERLIGRGSVIARDGPSSPFRNNKHGYQYPVRKGPLPLIAIISFAFGPATQRNKNELSALACYAAEHGYALYVEHMQLQADRHFMFTKIRTIQKYLPNFQWVFYVDSDMVVINRSRSLEEYLDDKYDFIFQEKDSNWEYSTGAFFVKNSGYSRHFLHEWLSMADGDFGPFGMGDHAAFHVLLLNEYRPPGFESCLDIEVQANTSMPDRFRRQTYNADFIPCFHRVTRYRSYQHIKVLAPLQGFLHTFEAGWEPAEYFHRLFPGSEFFVHGKQVVNLLTIADVYCEKVMGGVSRTELLHTHESAVLAAERMGFVYPPKPLKESSSSAASS